MLINSRQNSKIKQARSLLTRKARTQSGLFLVEGIRHVGEAIQARYPLEHLFYAPELLRSPFAEEMIEQARARGIPVYEVPPDLFQTLAEKEAPQGIVAVAQQRSTLLAALTPEAHPWMVAAITPQDPGNVGTLLRTIDAVGADGLILIEGGADPWHPTAVRASMGALFWLPVAQVRWDAFIGWAQAFHVYGTSVRGAADYREVEYARPCVLLLGSEREGLSQEQTAACKTLVRLPMSGRVSSLNLAVAAGILLYEMRPS